MYKISTYFYWWIIICLKFMFSLEYMILRLFRWPILKLLKIILLKKYQINLFLEDEVSVDHISRLNSTKEKKPNQSIVNIRVKNKNLILKFITEGRFHLLEGCVQNQIGLDSILELTRRVHQDALNTYIPLWRLQDWVYLNSSEFPWDEYSTTNSNDWASSDTKTVMFDLMEGGLNCTSGYWDKDVTDVNIAIDRNMKKIGDKLNLKPGMKVLDLGCGTGTFANYLATNYFVKVIGINFCQEEVNKAEKSNPNVQIICGDYRILLENANYHEYFDRVVSIHLLEHLGGPKWHSEYFNSINKYLKPEIGKLFIQSMVLTRPMSPRVDLFGRKYYVPRFVTPFTKEIIDGLTNCNFTILNIESTGKHFGRTLMEYGRLVHSIPEESMSKNIMEMHYNLGALGYKLRILDTWQIIANK